nr:MAG TPA: hypothetical protein [Caudoviricetes sp.]
MVKIIEISNNHNQSIRIEGNKLTYKEAGKVTVTTLYSHMVDEEDLILIGGCNSYQIIIEEASIYSKHIKQALRGLDGDKVVIFSEWAIAKRWRD